MSEELDPTMPAETKTKKKKAPKQEVIEKAPKVTARSIIREFLADKDEFVIQDIVDLVGGTKSNASTTITLLLKVDKAGKEGPIPFTYDKAVKKYTRN